MDTTSIADPSVRTRGRADEFDAKRTVLREYHSVGILMGI